MAIIEGGTTAALAEVDATYKAMRVTNRPMEFGANGAYALSQATGVMAAGLAASSEIFQFRWTDPTKLCVITRVVLDGAANAGTAFVAGVAKFESVIARSWTVDGSGGTAATLTTNNNKLRTSFATTILGASRMSTTAALTAGTKTLDAQPFGQVLSGVTATAGVQFGNSDASFYDGGSPNIHPVILAQNEGIIIRATVPATGTWTAGISIRWFEVSSY